MCGIIGFFKPYNKDRIVDTYIHWRRKGEDGIGLMYHMNNKIYVKKYLKSPVNFIVENGRELMKIIDKEPNFIFYHTRKATIGKVDKTALHPFIGNRYIIMHNGTVRKYDKIKKNENWKYTAGSDTERIVAFLNISDNRNLIEKLQELVDTVKTIGVLVIYDRLTRTIYLYRDYTRELVLSTKDNDVLFIDDVDKITGFYNSIKLARRFFNKDSLIEVEPYTVLEVNMNGIVNEIYKLKEPILDTGHIVNPFNKGTIHYV